MPEIVPKSITSYSSEDKQYPASNLLNNTSFSKWLCEKGGSKQEAIEFSFAEPVSISRIDIGNNASAFVEVLAQRSAAASNSDHTAFLPSSSFMSPPDSKQLTANVNRVRVFNTADFCANAVGQKWDRFKFICSQPFNKQVQYGLSFVTFFTAQSAPVTTNGNNANTATTNKQQTTGSVGKSLVILDEPDSNKQSESLLPGALFRASRQPPATSTTLSTTATNVTTSSSGHVSHSSATSSRSDPTQSLTTKQPASSTSTTPKTSQRPPPVAATVATSRTTSSNQVTNGRLDVTSSSSSAAVAKTHNSKTAATVANIVSTPSKTTASSRVSSSSTAPTASSKPFSGVVFSLSGFQNPRRSQLRDQALALGARFCQDWNSTCTHLVCAFTNTPKFKQVFGKGIIVSPNWITDSFKSKTDAGWRNYRLGRAPSPPSRASNVTTASSASSTAASVTTASASSTAASVTTASASSTATSVNTTSASTGRPRREASIKSETASAQQVDDSSVDVPTSRPISSSRSVADQDWQPPSVSSNEVEEEEEESGEEEEEASESPNTEEEDDDSKPSRRQKRKSKQPRSAPKGAKRSKPADADASSRQSTSTAGTTNTTATTLNTATNTTLASETNQASSRADEDGDESTSHHPTSTATNTDIDTDDEIDQALSKKSSTTDQTNSSAIALPNIFADRHFFLHNRELSGDQERRLNRLIVAFNGTVHSYMGPDVQFVVTESAWTDEFDQALKDNNRLIFVRPAWITACDRAAAWVPYQRFLVTG